MIEVRKGTYQELWYHGYTNKGYTFFFKGEPIAEMHDNLLTRNSFRLIVFGTCGNEDYVSIKTQYGVKWHTPPEEVLEKACRYLTNKIYKESMRNIDELLSNRILYINGEPLDGKTDRFLKDG